MIAPTRQRGAGETEGTSGGGGGTAALRCAFAEGRRGRMCAARDRVRVRRAGSGLDSTALASGLGLSGGVARCWMLVSGPVRWGWWFRFGASDFRKFVLLRRGLGPSVARPCADRDGDGFLFGFVHSGGVERPTE